MSHSDFSDLWTYSSGPSTNSNLTIAQKLEHENRQRTQTQPTQDVWAGLDALTRHPSSTSLLDTDPDIFAGLTAGPETSTNTVHHDDLFDLFGQTPHQEHENDDILGPLARPPAPPQPTPQRKKETVSRVPSPPPHVLGRLVEMGFSPVEARNALAVTATGVGLDVDAALEALLAEGERSGTPRRELRRNQERESKRVEREREAPRDPIQEHADRLIAQASEIGFSALSRATALWASSKGKVQRAYEERAAKASVSASSGRPRWMQDAVEEDLQPQPKPQPRRQAPQQAPQQDPPTRHKFADRLLFDDEPVAVYRSPFRHKQSSQTPAPSSAPTSTPARPVSPPPPPAVTASPATLAQAEKHRTTGASMHALGRYAEADTAYTRALSILPPGHVLRAPLCVARAEARVRIGDFGGAVNDCGEAVDVVGRARARGKVRGQVVGKEEEDGVKLGGVLLDAWRRRAEAWEGREKWEEAGKDWGSLAGVEWAPPGVRAEAARGAARCRRLLSGTAEPPAPKPKPKPTPIRRGPTPPSQALDTLRATNAAAEAEANERHTLKDSVDARLEAWKGGKETNVRALIASLDTVLWPELGWTKVGMGELITPSQVKVRYMRAVAKVHPDKLGGATVEQNMIASGVFGALNEAWIAFKQ